MRRRLRRSEHQDPRHPQQPDPQASLWHTNPQTPCLPSAHRPLLTHVFHCACAARRRRGRRASACPTSRSRARCAECSQTTHPTIHDPCSPRSRLRPVVCRSSNGMKSVSTCVSCSACRTRARRACRPRCAGALPRYTHPPLRQLHTQPLSCPSLSPHRRQRDRVVRRGLAMMIESDFYACARPFSNAPTRPPTLASTRQN